MQLSTFVKILPITTLAQGVAGQTDITGATIDVQGFSAGMFVVPVGSITAGAVTSIKLEHGDTSDLSNASTIAYSGQSIPDTASDGLFYIDVRRFSRRYVRLVIKRATQNSSFGPAVCQLYDAAVTPTVHPAGVVGEVIASAANGYA